MSGYDWILFVPVFLLGLNVGIAIMRYAYER